MKSCGMPPKKQQEDVILVLENEAACNTATAAEAAKVLGAVSSPIYAQLDPGNAAERDEKPYPDGYNLLPKIALATAIAKMR